MNGSGGMVDSTKVTKDLKLIWCKRKRQGCNWGIVQKGIATEHPCATFGTRYPIPNIHTYATFLLFATSVSFRAANKSVEKEEMGVHSEIRRMVVSPTNVTAHRSAEWKFGYKLTTRKRSWRGREAVSQSGDQRWRDPVSSSLCHPITR